MGVEKTAALSSLKTVVTGDRSVKTSGMTSRRSRRPGVRWLFASANPVEDRPDGCLEANSKLKTTALSQFSEVVEVAFVYLCSVTENNIRRRFSP